jgi:hypothetical protein
MSHFVCVVLCPPSELSPEREVERLLAPYSENLEVEPRPEECYCVGNAALARASDIAIAKHGTWEEMRAAFKKRAEESGIQDDQAKTQALWETDYYGPFVATRTEAMDADPEKTSADPECEECKGSGTYQTTSNPKGYWDWYQIGGRWSGYFDKAYNADEDPANVERCIHCRGTGRRKDKTAVEWGITPLVKEVSERVGLSTRLYGQLRALLEPKPDAVFGTRVDLDALGSVLLRGADSRRSPIEESEDPSSDQDRAALNALLEKLALLEGEGTLCNGCEGKGTAPKWPTQRGRRDSDMAPTERVVEMANAGEKVIPYAMVTPDGEWHQKGQMGWFGTSSNEMDEDTWREHVYLAYETHPGHMAVAVDCHT